MILSKQPSYRKGSEKRPTRKDSILKEKGDCCSSDSSSGCVSGDISVKRSDALTMGEFSAQLDLTLCSVTLYYDLGNMLTYRGISRLFLT